jgi:hypothetical protein
LTQLIEPETEAARTPHWKSWGGSLVTPILALVATVVSLVAIIVQWKSHHYEAYCSKLLAEIHLHEQVHGTLQGCFVGNPNALATSIWLGAFIVVLFALALVPRSWASSWAARILSVLAILISALSLLPLGATAS